MKRTLNEIQELVHEEYINNGYKYMWNLLDLKMLLEYFSPKYINSNNYFKGEQWKQLLTIADIGEVGLINTEVSELLEDIRKDKGLSKQGEECADIVIRVMNYCNRKGIDLEDAILTKHYVNMSREKLHGKVV